MGPISLKKGIVDSLTEDLVESITQLEGNCEDGQAAAEFALSNFRFNKFLDVNSFDVSRKLSGLCEKFKVHSDPQKAEEFEALTSTFLALPISAEGDSKEHGTELHYSLLSLLLLLSDAPLTKEYVAPDEKEAQAYDVIDWKSLLLDDTAELSIGIHLDERVERVLNDSDFDLSESSEDELEEAANRVDDTSGNHYGKDPRSRVCLPHEKDPSDSSQSNVRAADVQHAEMLQSLSWMRCNVMSSYWRDDSARTFHCTGAYERGQCAVANNCELVKQELDQLATFHQQPKEIVTELIVIRESLWLLQGSHNSTLYTWMDGVCSPRGDLLVSHLSSEMLCNVMSKFAMIGTMLGDLYQFAADCAHLTVICSKTFRAFGFSLGCCLKATKCFLSMTEKSIIASEHTVTLAILMEQLQDEFVLIRCLHSLYDQGIHASRSKSTAQTTVHFLNRFYELLKSTHADSGTAVCAPLLRLFVDTITPYLSYLDDWMSHGALPAVGHEFFIHRRDGIEKDTIEYWRETFRVQGNIGKDENGCVPEILRECVSQILLAGKSVNLLQDLGMLELCRHARPPMVDEFTAGLTASALPDRSATTSQAEEAISQAWGPLSPAPVSAGERSLLLRRNFLDFCRVESAVERQRNRAHPDDDAPVDHCGECHLPVDLLLKDSLYPSIDHRYRTGCRMLLNLFKSEFNLLDHLKVMKDFHLMAAGDTMALFYTELFHKISKKIFWQDVSYLNIVLHDALLLQHPHLIDKLTVELSEKEKRASLSSSASETSLTFESIQLRYELPHPVSVVLDSVAELQYNTVFRFLLHLKHAMWSVERVSFTALQCTGDSAASFTNRHMILRQRLFLFRFRLLHFIQNLHVYVMTRILHSTGLEFEAQLAEAHDVDQIISMHKEFLVKILDRCLLSEKVGLVQEAISRILKIAVTFRGIWNRGIGDIDEDRVVQLEEEYGKCLQFVLSFLRNLAKRGSFPHLELLATSLMA